MEKFRLFVLIPSVVHTEFLTQQEAADLLQMSIRTTRTWTRKGLLRAYKFGNRIFYRRIEVIKQLVTSKSRKP